MDKAIRKVLVIICLGCLMAIGAEIKQIKQYNDRQIILQARIDSLTFEINKP